MNRKLLFMICWMKISLMSVKNWPVSFVSKTDLRHVYFDVRDQKETAQVGL